MFATQPTTRSFAERRGFEPLKWYAKSSGTTNDKSKFIPVSHDGLHGIHYAGGFDAACFFLK